VYTLEEIPLPTGERLLLTEAVAALQLVVVCSSCNAKRIIILPTDTGADG
jgi:hypothetical protein